MNVCDQFSTGSSLIVDAASTVMLSVDAKAMLPGMAELAIAHTMEVTNHNNVSDLGADRSTTVKSVFNVSGTLSKAADFCFTNSAWDKAPLTRLASSNGTSLNIIDMDPTPVSHGMCRIGNRAECGKALQSELLVNAALKINENGSRVAVWGAH